MKRSRRSHLKILVATVVAPLGCRDEDTMGLLQANLVDTDKDADGYSVNHGDCDDSDPAQNPAATEVCDGIDNNCSGAVDEFLTYTTYLDRDGDGFGDPLTACSAYPGDTPRVDRAEDCDDSDPDVNPKVPDYCGDGADSNCDGVDATCGLVGILSASDADALRSGENQGDLAGSTSTCIGDLTGDGLSDLVIGAPDYDTR